MIKLNVTGHNDMCGGYSYDGSVSFQGTTVKEVLNEIREYAKNKNAHYLGDGFGNPDSENCNCWSISIDGIVYWNSWIEQCWETYKTYDHSLDNLVVDRVLAGGGWYCFYDFKIFTKNYKG